MDVLNAFSNNVVVAPDDNGREVMVTGRGIGYDLSRTFQMTELFNQVFQILDSAYGRHFDTESINAARIITHLRYFFVRIDKGKQLVEGPESFTSNVRNSFSEAQVCAERVKALIELRLEKPITADEVVYLTLHVARLASEQK